MSESTRLNRTTEVPEVDIVPPPSSPQAWAGWVTFAGISLALVGVVHVIEGLVGVLDPGQYAVRPSGLIVTVSYTVWGWTHLVLGIVLVAAAVGVLNRNRISRIIAVVACGLSALTNIAFLNAAPIWAVTVITLDVLFIYAITVHGGEVPVNRGSERGAGFTGPGSF
jgi:hypothetical protein